MSDFRHAIPVILAHETLPGSTDGSYTNTPGDKGGPTKWGLSLYRFWLGKDPDDFPGLFVSLSFAPPETPEQVRALTRGQAEETYLKCWWNRFGYDRVDDQRCATKILDMSVNMRRPVAHQLAQRAANDCGANLSVDGIFGEKTVQAINGTEANEYLNALCHEHLAFYQVLIHKHPEYQRFKAGWFARAAWPFHPVTTMEPAA